MKEYQERYAQRARDDHEREGALSRLNTAPFVALLGPLAIAVLYLLQIGEPPKPARLAIIGTAPLALLLLVINFIRLPVGSLFSRPALQAAAGTIVLAAGTIALAKWRGLL